MVLTPEEVAAVLARLEGAPWLVASLLYGSGLGLLTMVYTHVLNRGGLGVRSPLDRV